MSDRNEPSAGERAVHSLTAWARRRYGRRALFLGAAAASAGLAADVVVGGAAQAAPDAAKPVLLGKQNVTSGATAVGSSNSNGFEGHTHTTGKSGIAGLDFNKTKGSQGVYGQTYHGNGVFGIGIGGGNGVGAHSNTSGFSALHAVDSAKSGGTAVLAQSTHGLALHAEGKVKMSTASGVHMVPGGQRTATIQVAGMSASCKVFATIQQAQSGVHIEGAEPGEESITLTLSKHPSAPLRVAWFVLE
ncbi:MAG TPA: hypothetical protein VFI65_19580 [Streptosporangiaceae bacterium]|nr:hypothetical protein [Streptosporangiaceae bacterium]